VTICIAAVCDGGQSIVVAADRMFTAGPPVNLEFFPLKPPSAETLQFWLTLRP